MVPGCQNVLLDSCPWSYIDKYYKFVSRKEGSDNLYSECQKCLPRKKVVAYTKKSRNVRKVIVIDFTLRFQANLKNV